MPKKRYPAEQIIRHLRESEVELAKRLKELEKENTRLKRLVGELALEKQVLQDVAQGNF